MLRWTSLAQCRFYLLAADGGIERVRASTKARLWLAEQVVDAEKVAVGAKGEYLSDLLFVRAALSYNVLSANRLVVMHYIRRDSSVYHCL